jgi:hypothetical protein
MDAVFLGQGSHLIGLGHCGSQGFFYHHMYAARRAVLHGIQVLTNGVERKHGLGFGLFHHFFQAGKYFAEWNAIPFGQAFGQGAVGFGYARNFYAIGYFSTQDPVNMIVYQAHHTYAERFLKRGCRLCQDGHPGQACYTEKQGPFLHTSILGKMHGKRLPAWALHVHLLAGVD